MDSKKNCGGGSGSDGADSDIKVDLNIESFVENKLTQQNYTILNELEIRQRMEDDIARVSSVLSLSRSEAIILLIHYNWCDDKINDAWFAEEHKVRQNTGLLEKPLVQLSQEDLIVCGLCLKSFSHDKIDSVACGHPFCNTCLGNYINMSIKNLAHECLMLRCAAPCCDAVVTQDMINKLASSDDDKIKYYCYLVRSYVEHSKYIKWCPARGCECAVELGIDHDGISYQVTCIYKCTFCWNCLRDGHRPVDCKTVEKWIKEIESNGLNGISVHAKPCPSCKQPIENTQSIPQMTCCCGFQFCWTCLLSYTYHPRDPYIRSHCETIKRHKYYYERWINSHSLMQKALDNLLRVENEDVIRLGDIYHESETQFLTEAWIQIVECRRVLKWTCAYGYFIPEHEFAKKQLFEHLQSLADSNLQKLQQCAEGELQLFLSPNHRTLIEYYDFRTKLVKLTEVTRRYFDNLVRDLESGLSDVDSQLGNSTFEEIRYCNRCTYANPLAAMSCQMCQNSLPY